MGRKRYFCDFCSKSFVGDPKSRALHLNSARHIQIRKEYYASFIDPEQILDAESRKIPCPYIERGCKFGINCNFSHYHPEQLRALEAIVDERRCKKEKALPTFSEWCRKQTQSAFVGSRISHDLEVAESNFLPISLKPFDIADYLAADFSAWGD